MLDLVSNEKYSFSLLSHQLHSELSEQNQVSERETNRLNGEAPDLDWTLRGGEYMKPVGFSEEDEQE